MQTPDRFMQIIDRHANERIVIDQQLTVTVVEVLADEVTLEIAGPDGDVQQVTLHCNDSDIEESVRIPGDLVCC